MLRKVLLRGIIKNCFANMLKGNREFVMLDEQKVVYEEIFTIPRI